MNFVDNIFVYNKRAYFTANVFEVIFIKGIAHWLLPTAFSSVVGAGRVVVTYQIRNIIVGGGSGWTIFLPITMVYSCGKQYSGRKYDIPETITRFIGLLVLALDLLPNIMLFPRISDFFQWMISPDLQALQV